MALLWEGGPSSLAPCPSGFGSAHPGMPASEPVQQRFWSSIARGDATEVARSLVDGADANALDPVTGATALHKVAASSSSSAPKLVDMLLIAHADPHAVDSSSRTPLLVAANMGNLPVVRALLARGTQLWPSASATVRRICCSHDAPCSAHSTSALPHPPSHTNTTPSDNDAAFLAIRSTCPLAAAAAAARWPTVAALLSALPPNFRTCPHALRSLRFLIWALASHKAFPRDVIAALPPRLPPCVVNAVRPAHLASTPLVLATGNDQQQLMQWLLQQGADPELGAPLLLCAGRFCRGSRTCCVSCLLRRGARPHVAWADNPEDSPLYMAAKGDCFSHVHCLVAYGADVDGEAARVRAALYGPEPWEAHLDRLLVQYGSVVDFDRDADLLCPCGQQHARWPGSWPLEDGPDGSACEELVGAAGQRREEGDRPGVAGSEGNSCSNPEPSDDGWYRKHAAQLEQLQDGNELAECLKGVRDLWEYGNSAVRAELGAAAAITQCSPLPSRVLAAMQDVAGGWLAAAVRCRTQRLMRLDLYDKAVAAGRQLLYRKRVAALAALGGLGMPTGPGSGGACDTGVGSAGGMGSACQGEDGGAVCLQQACVPRSVVAGEGGGCRGLVPELRMAVLAMAGLAPPQVQQQAAQMLAPPPSTVGACACKGCSDGEGNSIAQ